MKNNKYIVALFLFLSVVFLQEVYAQSIEDAFGAGSNNTNDSTAAPIDMLVYLGLAFGGYVGVKKLKKK